MIKCNMRQAAPRKIDGAGALRIRTVATLRIRTSEISSLFFAVPRRGGTVGRIWRARGSNNTVYSTGAKPTRVEGPADSDSPLIFIFQNDLSRLQQRFEVGQD